MPGNYYRPVFMLWCRLNDAAFDGQAGLWHLTTVATHLIATLLVYFLSLRLVRDRLTAGIAALLFGLNPVHLEAVAWIAGVTEPLLGVFFLGSFLCYLKGRGRSGWANLWLISSLSIYALGLLAKETEAVLPIIILVYEWLFSEMPIQAPSWRARFTKGLRAARAAAPFVLLTIPYLFARVIVLKGFMHPFVRLSSAQLPYTWPSLIWFWARHLAVPIGLGSCYDIRMVEHPSLLNFVVPTALVAACGAAMVWAAKRSREVAFACAWMVVPLIPLLDFRVLPRNDFAHDRFLYLPSVGVAILVALAIGKVNFAKARLLGHPAAQIVGGLLLAAALGISAARQSFYFENNWIFFRYNHLLSPRNVHCSNDYAILLGNLGMKSQAIEILEQAVKEDPEYWSAVYDLGYFYYQSGQFKLAERCLMRAVIIDPSRSNGFFLLGLTEMKTGEVKQAEAAFRAAIRENPLGKEYHYELGLALQAQHQVPAALNEFEQELAVNPGHPDARRLVRQIQAGGKVDSTGGKIGVNTGAANFGPF